MIRWTPSWGHLASDLGTRPVGRRALLRRFAAPARGDRLLGLAVGARGRGRVRRADPGAVPERTGRGVGCRLTAAGRLVRRLRADRLAAPSRQPQRTADDRHRRRVLPLPAAEPGRGAGRPDARLSHDGLVDSRVRPAAADDPDRWAHAVQGRLAARGGVRATAGGACSRSGCCSGSSRATCSRSSRTPRSPMPSTRPSERLRRSQRWRPQPCSQSAGRARRGRGAGPCCRAWRVRSRCCCSRRFWSTTW